MADISQFIAKGQNVVGTANAFRDFLPDSVRNGLDTFLNGTRAPGSDRKGINKIQSTINKLNGLQRSSHYYVTIPAPLVLAGDQVPPLIPFLTEATSLPGVMMNTTPIKRYGYGPEEKKPYAPTFVDINMTFFGDGKGAVHDFFYRWLNKIVIFDKNATDANAFEVYYKNSYATDITITTIDETGNIITEVTLLKAYPIFLGDISLSWHDNDSFVRIPVGFTFYNWKKKTIDLNTPVLPGQGASAMQKILGVATAIQTLSTIRKPNNVADIINVVGNSKIAIGGLNRIL